jgi:hypothetical protein
MVVYGLIKVNQGWASAEFGVAEGSAMDGLGGELWESFTVSAAASRDVSRSGGGGVVGLELPPVSRLIKVGEMVFG